MMAAGSAGEPPLIVSHLVIATLQQNRLPLNDGFCNDLSCLLNDPTESGPGNAHPRSGFLLRQSFQIGQAQGFHLIDGQPHLLDLPQGDPTRLEVSDRWITGNDAIFLWSSQFHPILGIYSLYAATLINISRPNVNSTYITTQSSAFNGLRKKRRCAMLATGVVIQSPHKIPQCLQLWGRVRHDF
jgi:hypothetical protein